MTLRLDLNADLGEGGTSDDELLALITSASVACGAHAGDDETMRRTVKRAAAHGVAVGAHPGYADREGFGRRELALTPAEVRRLVGAQVARLDTIATQAGLRLQHVKAHGALYNRAARDLDCALALAEATREQRADLVFVGLPGSCLEQAARRLGLRFAAEAFADRTYADDGTLTSRSRADAFVHDPGEAAARVLGMLHDGGVRATSGRWIALRADTVCVHGDNPGAVAFARSLRAGLQGAGVELRALREPEAH